MGLYLTGDKRADAFLEKDPFALLVGMVLDQQIPLERAFTAPTVLRERLGGTLDAAEIAQMDPEKLVAVFSERPALHRFPGSMAERVQALARIVVDQYGGNAASIWKKAKTGKELMSNVKALPGFGEQKAKIFIALLGKRLSVTPDGWDTVAGTFATPGSFMSIADIDSPEALLRVRQYKTEMKAAAKAAKGEAEPKPKRSPAKR
jgi:uncharacterized HhH-GPD family protein